MEIRYIDRIRRITIPKKILKELNICARQELEINLCYGKISIKKFQRSEIKNRPYVGIIREIDELNRIIIPVEYAELLNIRDGDEISIELKDTEILVQKKE